jgi:hypothetical protein
MDFVFEKLFSIVKYLLGKVYKKNIFLFVLFEVV